MSRAFILLRKKVSGMQQLRRNNGSCSHAQIQVSTFVSISSRIMICYNLHKLCPVRSSSSSRRSENVATVGVLEADGLNCSCRLRKQSGIETLSYFLRRVSERGRIVRVDERSRALSQQSSICVRPGVGQCLQKSGGRTECAPAQKSEKIHNGVEDAQ